MKSVVLFVVFFLFGQTLFATIHTISLDGTGDFTAIQDGIDASSNDDTVLVYPGIYYENINYDGKNITVASLYLTTQIDSFVQKTIIDGNHNGSVVKAINGEDETALLCGFTIQYGTGSIDQYNYICGGGLNIYDSQIVINNCIIKKNRAEYGGGIYIGGSYSGDACPTLENCLITSNHSYRHGGGVSLSYWASVVFSQDELCSIYLNSGAVGSDICRGGLDSDSIHVYVDTFTVMVPDAFFFSDFVGSTIDIQHGKITPINQDLYVAPDGDNTNSGITEDEPLKNIYFALTKITSDRLHPNTIHIVEGTYSPSLTGEKYPLNLRSYITLDGAGKEYTVLDAEQLSCIFYDYDYQRDYTIKEMKIVYGKKSYGGAITYFQPRNVLIENVRFENNVCPDGGRSVIGSPSLSAFILDSTKVTLNNIEAINNWGGKAITTGPVEQTKIINSLIKNNKPNYQADFLFGGGLIIVGISEYDDRWFTQVINTEISENINAETAWPNAASALVVMNKQNADFINCTIGNNDSPLSGEGISIEYGSNVGFYNCILYGDDPREMYVDGQIYSNTVTFKNTLLEGGQWDIAVQGTNTINWLDGNLDTNPMWVGIGEYPYYLSTGSPCIDAGTLDLPDSIEIPLNDLAGNPRIYGDMIDMGAYEWQGYGVDDEPELPEGIITFMNIPNPFRDYTNIVCSIKDINITSEISLKIYNARGQLIKTFEKDNFALSPYTEIYWDGTDEKGYNVAPGAYFCKLEYNGHAVVRKIVLLR